MQPSPTSGKDRHRAHRGVLEPVCLPGIPITDPAWAEARRGRRPPNFGRTFPAEPLTVSEVVALMLACDSRRRYLVARDRALVVVLWRCGGRIREVLSLHPKDLDLPRGGIHVLRGKGARDRWVGIDPTAASFIERWLAERVRIGVPAGTPLFCTVLQQRHRAADGPWRPLSDAYVRNWLKQLGHKAGVEKRVHPHGFRHTHTNELVGEDFPLPLIQAQLGHKHLSSTEAYIRRIAAPELLRAITRRPWPDVARALLAA
jgi:integrase